MRFSLLLSAALLAVLSPVPAYADESPQLRRSDGSLVDEHGRTVLVHGVNLVWKHAPYAPPDSPGGFTEADAEWLADHGFNGARLGTLWAGVSPTGPGSVDASYFARWQRVMDLLADREVWMQLDFHQDQWHETYGGEGAPGWAVKRPFPYNLLPPVNAQFPLGYWTPEQSQLWDNLWAGKDGLLDAWAGSWRAVAAHWKDQPYLMGYDLLNEPWAGLEGLTSCLAFGCPSTYTNELQPAMTKALRRIREVDPANLVWFEPEQLSAGQGTPTSFTAIPGEEQLGLSWHSYCPAVFFESQGLPLMDVESCASYNAQIHGRRTTETARMNAAGLLSEFGATDNVTALELDTAEADKHFASWMYWAYKVWNDPTTADTAQGLFTDDADLSTAKPKLSTLVRTYPQATCGTPRSMSFDPATGAFRYSYTASSCNGRPTEIFVSPLHYPDGYDVQLSGGTLAGTGPRGQLHVAAVRGAAVTVSVLRATP